MLSPYQEQRAYHEADHKVAMQFAQELKKELHVMLREAMFFGSGARRTTAVQQVHDIDVLIILDDMQKVMSRELVEAYRVITENVASRIDQRLHINTVKLSSFWEYVTQGDPIVINILRDGMPLLDSGMIPPLKGLLDRGLITPSKESVWGYYLKAPQTLEASQWHVLQATIDLYWAMLDAMHAALITLGTCPHSPEEAEKMLKEELIGKQGFDRKGLELFRKLHQAQERIARRDVQHITGKTYDTLLGGVRGFQQEVKNFIRKH